MRENLNLVFLGGPGSGKDTQIEKLKEAVDFEVISSGDICRKRARMDKTVKDIIEKGGLISDETITDWVEEEIKGIPISKNIIFNGFPRDLGQAEALERILISNGRELDGAFFLRVPEDELVYRLTKRVFCDLCGKKVVMDREECSNCGGKVITRKDDSPEIIITRIKIFNDKIKPLLEYYKNKGKLFDLDGARKPEVIMEDAMGKMETL